jgi:hypothetical protein
MLPEKGFQIQPLGNDASGHSLPGTGHDMKMSILVMEFPEGFTDGVFHQRSNPDLKKRMNRPIGTDLNAAEALYALFRFKNDIHTPPVRNGESIGGTVRNTASALGTEGFVPLQTFLGHFYADIQRADKIGAPFYVFGCTCNIQNQKTILFRCDSGSIDIDNEVIVLDQVINNGFFRFTLGKIEHEFLSDQLC